MYKICEVLNSRRRRFNSAPLPQLGDEENDGNYFGRFFERNFVFARKDLVKFFFGGTGNRKVTEEFRHQLKLYLFDEIRKDDKK